MATRSRLLLQRWVRTGIALSAAKSWAIRSFGARPHTTGPQPALTSSRSSRLSQIQTLSHYAAKPPRRALTSASSPQARRSRMLQHTCRGGALGPFASTGRILLSHRVEGHSRWLFAALFTSAYSRHYGFFGLGGFSRYSGSYARSRFDAVSESGSRISLLGAE